MRVRSYFFTRLVDAGEVDSPSENIAELEDKEIVSISINALTSDFEIDMVSSLSEISALSKYGSDTTLKIYERASLVLKPDNPYFYLFTSSVNWSAKNIGSSSGYYVIFFDVVV